MARSEGHEGGGGRGRRGLNLFARDPEREWNSKRYEEVFDPRKEENYGNRFLEIPDQIRLRQLRDRQKHWEKDTADDDDASKYNLKAWPHMIYLRPADNSWAANVDVVTDPQKNLGFHPHNYLFDYIIAEKFGKRALYDPTEPDFAHYEGMRTNLAALRNFLISGDSFAKGNTVDTPRLQSVAEALGDALANHNFAKTVFTRPFNPDVANIEGAGAAEMYAFLQSIQTPPNMFSTLVTNVRSQLGLPDRRWKLPELAETPFSDENLRAARTTTPPAAPPAASAVVQPSPLDPDGAGQMVALSQSMGNSVRRINAVDALAEPDRAQAVVEAHTILRWLRNLQLTDMDVMEWLDQGTPPEQIAKSEKIDLLVQAYDQQLLQARRHNPAITEDPAIADASNAAAALALAVTERALDMLPAGHADIATLESIRSALPPSSDALQGQSVERLLDMVMVGLEKTSGKTLGDHSAAERLAEISQRIQSSVRQLKSLDTLEPPAREESLELARIILDYFKNLKLGDASMEKLADTGRPEDKAALAQKIEQMVDTYKNLLLEIAQTNPDIMKDPLIVEANDAVSSFGAAVSLMAAKEMPNSIASAQQISAVDENALGSLADRTLSRVVKSMEGGMEKAVNELESQQNEDQAQQETRDANVQLNEHVQGKAGRKKRKSRSGFGGRKQQKMQQDISADDFVLKQGRFSEPARAEARPTRAAPLRSREGKVDLGERKTADKAVAFKPEKKKSGMDKATNAPKADKAKPVEKKIVVAVQPSPEPVFLGLNAKDLAALHEESRNLRAFEKQAQATPGSTPVFDDQNFAARNNEERDRQNKAGNRVG